jgi:hypothetical protein
LIWTLNEALCDVGSRLHRARVFWSVSYV